MGKPRLGALALVSALLCSMSQSAYADCTYDFHVVCQGYTEFGATNSADGGTIYATSTAIVDGNLSVGYNGTVTNEGLVRGALVVSRYSDALNLGTIRSSAVGIRGLGSDRTTVELGILKYLPLALDDIQSHDYNVGNNDLENYGSIQVSWDQYFDLGAIALGATGIRSAPDDTAINFGSIEASGEFAAGIFGADYAGVLNAAGATIDVDGANGYGIVLLGLPRGAAARNEGMITGTGEYVRGMDLIGQGYLTNLGTIEVDGFSSLGMRGETGPLLGSVIDLTNGAGATLRVTGDDSEGMRAVVSQGADARGVLTNDGTIEVAGDGAVGFWLEGAGQIMHNGTLRVNGYNSGGIEASSAGWGAVQIETAELSNIAMSGDSTDGVYLLGQGSILHGGVLTVNGASSWGVAGATEQNTDEIDIVNSGEITMQAGGSAGIYLAGTGGAGNSGTVTINGIDSAGMLVGGDEIDAVNANGGRIDIHASGSAGIYAELANGTIGNQGVITTDAAGTAGVLAIGTASGILNTTNTGEIRTTADVSLGMLALGGNHNFVNQGEIQTAGNQSFGMALGLAEIPVGVSLPAAAAEPARGNLRNEGIIQTRGTGADGVHVRGANNDVSNVQRVTTFGEDAAGVAAVGNGITVTNEDTGVILTEGFQSDGIRVEGDGARLINGHQIQVSGSIDISEITETTGRTRAMVAEGNSAYLENRPGAEIRATGVLSGGMRAVGDAADLHNRGTIIVDSEGGASGMDVTGDLGRIENHAGATITVAGAASRAVNLFDVVDATVVNAGTITGNGTYLQGVQASGDLVTVENSGLIELNGTSNNIGISTLGYQNDINNAGTIRVTGEQAGGINVRAPADLLPQRRVVNSGAIQVTGTNSFGVSLSGREATVINGTGATISAEQTGARGLTVDGNDHLIINQGIVTVDGTDARAVALRGTNISLANDAGAAITASGANGVAVSSAGNGATLANGGLIIATGTDSVGIALSGSDALIDNAGTIAVDAAGASAITWRGDDSAATAEVVNAGSVSSSNSAAPTISFNSTESQGVVLRNAKGGTIANTSGGQAILGGAGSETLVLDAGSEISGSIDLSGGDDTMFVAGTVNGATDLNSGNDILMLLDGFELKDTVDGGQSGLNLGTRRVTTSGGDTLDLINDAIVADLGGSSQVNGTDLTGFESLTKAGTGTLAVDGDLSVDEIALLHGGLTVLSGASAQSENIVGVDGEFALNTGSAVSTENLAILGGRTSIYDGAELAAEDVSVGGGSDIAELHLYDGTVSLTSDLGGMSVYENGLLAGSGVIDCSRVDDLGGIDDLCGLRGGAMAPGDSPGEIDILGDFLFDGGTLDIEVGGYDPGSFDILNIDGTAIVRDLEIDFSFLDGFMPDPFQTIDFLSAGNLIGFENIDFYFGGMPDGLSMDLVQTASGLAMQATVPEPGTFSLIAAGLLGMFLYRRRRLRRWRTLTTDARSMTAKPAQEDGLEARLPPHGSRFW